MEDNEDEAKVEPEFESELLANARNAPPSNLKGLVGLGRVSITNIERLEATPRVDTERAADLCRLAITQLRDIKSPKLALGTLADLLEELS